MLSINLHQHVIHGKIIHLTPSRLQKSLRDFCTVFFLNIFFSDFILNVWYICVLCSIFVDCVLYLLTVLYFVCSRPVGKSGGPPARPTCLDADKWVNVIVRRCQCHCKIIYSTIVIASVPRLHHCHY